MMSRSVGVAAIVLWVIGAAIVGWLFVKGWTAPGADERTEIVLAPVERDQILGEMRQLLKAVQGVVTGLSDPAQGMKDAERAARAAGMSMAADVDPAIMMKLPLPFKQMGMSVHQDMDRLADAIARNEEPVKILHRLSGVTARCTACHDVYRLSAGR